MEYQPHYCSYSHGIHCYHCYGKGYCGRNLCCYLFGDRGGMPRYCYINGDSRHASNSRYGHGYIYGMYHEYRELI